jgi:hypothetical protein
LSPFLRAEECLEHWRRSLFFLRVSVFVALVIRILKLSLNHFFKPRRMSCKCLSYVYVGELVRMTWIPSDYVPDAGDNSQV